MHVIVKTVDDLYIAFSGSKPFRDEMKGMTFNLGSEKGTSILRDEHDVQPDFGMGVGV
jgi:hypothetical protein